MKHNYTDILTKDRVDTINAAFAALETVIESRPWSLTVEGSRTLSPVIKIYNGDLQEKCERDGRTEYIDACFGEISRETFETCRATIMTIIIWPDIETGEPAFMDDLLDHCLRYGGTLPLTGEAGVKLALFANLAHGIDDPARLTLLARRIARMDGAAADTYLDEITHPAYYTPTSSARGWAQAGLTLMFAGPEGDPDAVKAALETIED